MQHDSSEGQNLALTGQNLALTSFYIPGSFDRREGVCPPALSFFITLDLELSDTKVYEP